MYVRQRLGKENPTQGSKGPCELVLQGVEDGGVLGYPT